MRCKPRVMNNNQWVSKTDRVRVIASQTMTHSYELKKLISGNNKATQIPTKMFINKKWN